MNIKLESVVLNYFKESFQWINYNYDELADWEKQIFTREHFEQMVSLIKKLK